MKLSAFLSSSKFFWLIVGLFVVQAGWIAATGVYPLAFDEEFHLGLIRLYADHGLPWWSAHPAGGDSFGPLTRDPSYLFHYLMSFPYKLIDFFTKSEATQVMLLRAINIGLFAWGLTLYRRLLLKTRASLALVNLSLLIFVLVPITPYLAAHINYDNLFIPLTALVLLLALKLRDSMKTGSLDVETLLKLTVLILFTALVKYAFLPVALVVVLYLKWRAWWVYRSVPKLWAATRIGARYLRKTALIGLVAAIVLMTGLFVERYGINLLRYHAPVPDCGQVLSYEHCKHYGVWSRDLQFERDKPASFAGDPVHFTGAWLRGMWFRCFFAIAGVTVGYENFSPLALPAIGAIVFAVVGLLALILAAGKVWRQYNSSVLWLLTVVTVVYLALLWLDVYLLYLKDGKPVAINGRYLLPILPWVVLMTAMGVNQLLGARRGLKLLLATLVVLCCAWGGGALTYILRSNDRWYWPSTPLKSANHAIKDVIGPVTPGYYSPHQFKPHPD